MSKKLNFIVVLIAPILIGVGCRIVPVAPQSSVNSLGTKESLANTQVTDLAFKDYNGKEERLRGLVGKPLVINSWASWCPFCKKELLDFAALQKEFGNKILVMAINRRESVAIAKKFSDELGVSNDLTLLVDPADSFYEAIGAFSMPETIFVDAEGNIVGHKRGPMELEEMRTKTQLLFK